MSEGDSTPHRRPPTIDLTATEVESGSPASSAAGTAHATEGGDGQATPQSRAGGLRAHAIGIAIGAVLVGALGCGLWASGLVPARNAPAAPANNATGEISAQLDKIQSELQSRPDDAALASRVAIVEAQTKTLSESLAAINRRLDDIAAAAQSAGQRAEAADQAAEGAVQTANAAADTAKGATQNAAQNSIQHSDLDALAGRIATLERSLKALSESTMQHRPAGTNDRAARAAIAAEALRAAVERGAPYQAELEAVKLLGADQKTLATLEPFASSGVPTAAALARELAQLTASLRPAAGTPSSGDTLLGRLEDNAKNLVRITPVDAPAGNEPSAAVARLGADAARDDIAAALTGIAALPQSAKTLVEPWVQKVNARAAAIAASRRIAADALAALGNSGTQ
jgi:hypothetical protein